MTKGTIVARSSPGAGEAYLYGTTGGGLFAVPHGLGVTPSTSIVCNGDGNSYGNNHVFSIHSTDTTYLYVKVINWTSGALRCNWVAFS
jgi:hypothetical protein